MNDSLEARLHSLERRLERIEQLLSLPPESSPAPELTTPRQPVSTPSTLARAQTTREPVDLEDVLGGRVLAWLGAVAVVLGVVFFLVMAVSRGWIDEPTRVLLAFLGSTALLCASLWLYERKGQTQAALAAAAASLASLYATLVVATVVYDLVPTGVGLSVAGLVGAVAAVIAVRWSSQVVAGVGLLGALLAPVLVDAGASTAALAFMALAVVAVVAVLVWQRWPWLAFGSFVVSAPQLIAWIDDETGSGDRRLLPVLAALLVYWALYLGAALAHELRAPTERLRVSSALLVFADVALVSGTGWVVLHDAGRTAEATAWVLVLAVAHVALGTFVPGRVSREITALLIALGIALSAIGLALALDGPALVVGWATASAVLAWLAVRTGDERAMFGAAIFVGLALGHLLVQEIPPDGLAHGVDSAAGAAAAIAAVVGAAAFAAWIAHSGTLPWRSLFATLAAATAIYGVSVLIVDLSGANDVSGTTQSGQLLVSAFWSATALAAIVAGLVRDARGLRIGGLVLLGAAVVKVFFVDLATLESIYRVGSFIALGLLLIACAFAYQRARHEIAK